MTTVHRGGYQGSAAMRPVTVPRTPGADANWPAWAYCDRCRHLWNLDTTLKFGPRTKAAANHFARVHMTHSKEDA